MRSVAPTRFGTAVRQNICGTVSLMPTFERLSTTMVHSTQMLKPRFSANTLQIRFLRATGLPSPSQNSSLSGSQSWSQRPRVKTLIAPPQSSVESLRRRLRIVNVRSMTGSFRGDDVLFRRCNAGGRGPAPGGSRSPGAPTLPSADAAVPAVADAAERANPLGVLLPELG